MVRRERGHPRWESSPELWPLVVRRIQEPGPFTDTCFDSRVEFMLGQRVVRSHNLKFYAALRRLWSLSSKPFRPVIRIRCNES